MALFKYACCQSKERLCLRKCLKWLLMCLFLWLFLNILICSCMGDRNKTKALYRMYPNSVERNYLFDCYMPKCRPWHTFGCDMKCGLVVTFRRLIFIEHLTCGVLAPFWEGHVFQAVPDTLHVMISKLKQPASKYRDNVCLHFVCTPHYEIQCCTHGVMLNHNR